MLPAQLLSSLNAADSWSLSSTAVRIMILVADGRAVRPSAISAILGCTPAAVHSSVKDLISRCILRKTRHTSGHDERGVRIRILPYGKRILENILEGNLQQSDSTTPAP